MSKRVQLTISFNSGEVPKKNIIVRVSEFTPEDEAIRDWIRVNGHGLLYNWRVHYRKGLSND